MRELRRTEPAARGFRPPAVLLAALLLGAAPQAAAAQDYTKTPVYFVHGSGGNSTQFDDMIAFLLAEGYPGAYLFPTDLVPQAGPNACSAELFVEPQIEQLLADANQAAADAGQPQNHTKVDVIAHSMGALSTRWYITKLRPDRVRTWIAMAGANHGTDALCESGNEGDDEMCPAFAATPADSELQLLLNGTPNAPRDETPYGLGADTNGGPSIAPDGANAVLYYSIRINPDLFIKPESSAIIDGCGGVAVAITPGLAFNETSPGNYLFTGFTGHGGILSEPDALQLVADLLAALD